MAAEYERLLADALAGALDERRARELATLLAQEPALRVELARHQVLDAWLRQLRRGPIDVDRVMRALPVRGRVASAVMRRVAHVGRPPMRMPWRPLVAAAAVVALACGWWLVARRGEPAPDVLAIGRRSGAVAGDVGSGLQLGERSDVVLVAGDGARFALSGPARLQVLRSGGRDGLALALDHGFLEVEAPPRAGRPLEIATPTAAMWVVGTRFTVTVDDAGTALAVTAGEVRFRARDGAERLVAAGERMSTAGATRLLAVAEDATADAAQPAAMLGAQEILQVRARAPERIACLRFRLPSEGLISATLVLRRRAGVGDVAVHRVDGAWDQATLRWWHAPHRGPRVGVLAAAADGTMRVDVTSACAAGVCELMLVGLGDADCSFRSAEAGAQGPALLLTVRP